MFCPNPVQSVSFQTENINPNINIETGDLLNKPTTNLKRQMSLEYERQVKFSRRSTVDDREEAQRLVISSTIASLVPEISAAVPIIVNNVRNLDSCLFLLRLNLNFVYWL